MIVQLHDNGQGLSTQQVWPPLKWDDAKPKTQQEILDHYYAYSAGCQTPTLWGSIALGAAGISLAAFAPAILGAAGKALTAIKAGTIAKVSGVVGAQAADLISKEASKQIKASTQKAGNTAKVKGRRDTDGSQERQRIVDAYLDAYSAPYGDALMRTMQTKNLSQLKSDLVWLKATYNGAYEKCKKMPCDTAGCRSMGWAAARMQYVEALIKAYEATGTTTPQEFNEQFTTAINEGKTSLKAGIGGLLPFLLILGVLFGKLKK